MTITIAPLVFERLAVRAAGEVPGVAGQVRSGLGRVLPWVDGAVAGAAADVEPDEVTLDLTFNVVYPEPVRQVTDEVRRHVAARIQELTGRAVGSINITVPELVEPERPRRRVR